MGTSHFGLDGSIGAPKTASYELKASSPGTKTYVKTFGRMGIDGGITKHARSYAGKEELQPNIFGGVQADNATVFGNIKRTAFWDVSGGVQAQAPILSGNVRPAKRTVSGGVTPAGPTVSGTVTSYPLTGWKLTDFGVNYSGLDPDSPFYNDPAYINLVIGDKCHYEATTSPDAHVPTMDANGEFTLSPAFLAQTQTFSVQIYDLSDGTFGATATITVFPGDADRDIAGGVQSQSPTLSGSINRFRVEQVSGGVQAASATLFGVIARDVDRIIVGGVQAQSATVSGTIGAISKVSGGVQAQPPILAGEITKIMAITGNVQAQSPTLSGDLSPPTEEPGTTDSREIIPKFINRKMKWKTRQRKIR